MEHFVFWGLFLAFFAIILLYWIWMVRTERSEDADERAEARPPEDDA